MVWLWIKGVLKVFREYSPPKYFQWERLFAVTYLLFPKDSHISRQGYRPFYNWFFGAHWKGFLVLSFCLSGQFRCIGRMMQACQCHYTIRNVASTIIMRSFKIAVTLSALLSNLLSSQVFASKDRINGIPSLWKSINNWNLLQSLIYGILYDKNGEIRFNCMFRKRVFMIVDAVFQEIVSRHCPSHPERFW